MNQDQYRTFGKAIYDLLSQRGWNVIPKREMTVSLLHLAHEAELLDLTQSRYALAAKLKISPATLDGLLRDTVLFFGKVNDLDCRGFVEWVRRNNHTSEDEAEKQKVVVAINSQEERMAVEKYLDDHNYVPDYKNNHRLLVFDLPRLLNALAQTADIAPHKLISVLNIDNKDIARAMHSEKKLIDLAVRAIKEQAGKKLGEATTELAITLFETVKKSLKQK